MVPSRRYNGLSEISFTGFDRFLEEIDLGPSEDLWESLVCKNDGTERGL